MWIVALKPDGYVILSAHESVPCDEIFKPLVSYRADRRFGSPVPDEVDCISPGPNPEQPIAIGHFIRPPILSSPCAWVRSARGRSMQVCMRRAREGGAMHDRHCAFPGDGQGRYTRRNSRYGAIPPSLVLLNVVSSVGLHTKMNRTSGRHVLSGRPADR